MLDDMGDELNRIETSSGPPTILRIIGVAIRNDGQVRFLVKWNGDPNRRSSFEPYEVAFQNKDCLRECLDRIRERDIDMFNAIMDSLPDLWQKFKTLYNDMYLPRDL